MDLNIETYANKNTKTATGKLVYPIADLFIVQWEEMLKVYPKATYLGGIPWIWHIIIPQKTKNRWTESCRMAAFAAFSEKDWGK